MILSTMLCFVTHLSLTAKYINAQGDCVIKILINVLLHKREVCLLHYCFQKHFFVNCVLDQCARESKFLQNQTLLLFYMFAIKT